MKQPGWRTCPAACRPPSACWGGTALPQSWSSGECCAASSPWLLTEASRVLSSSTELASPAMPSTLVGEQTGSLGAGATWQGPAGTAGTEGEAFRHEALGTLWSKQGNGTSMQAKQAAGLEDGHQSVRLP